MDVYVATKAENWREAQVVMGAIERAGHDITHDWTEAVRQHGPMPDVDDQARDSAEKDRQGVVTADVLVIISAPNIFGTAIEFGMACAENKPVLIMGEPHQRSVFWHLPNIKMITENNLSGLAYVVEFIDNLQEELQDELEG